MFCECNAMTPRGSLIFLGYTRQDVMLFNWIVKLMLGVLQMLRHAWLWSDSAREASRTLF